MIGSSMLQDNWNPLFPPRLKSENFWIWIVNLQDSRFQNHHEPWKGRYDEDCRERNAQSMLYSCMWPGKDLAIFWLKRATPQPFSDFKPALPIYCSSSPPLLSIAYGCHKKSLFADRQPTPYNRQPYNSKGDGDGRVVGCHKKWPQEYRDLKGV